MGWLFMQRLGAMSPRTGEVRGLQSERPRGTACVTTDGVRQMELLRRAQYIGATGSDLNLERGPPLSYQARIRSDKPIPPVLQRVEAPKLES